MRFEAKKRPIRFGGPASYRPVGTRRFSLNRIHQMSGWIVHVLAEGGIDHSVFAEDMTGNHRHVGLFDLPVVKLT